MSKRGLLGIRLWRYRVKFLIRLSRSGTDLCTVIEFQTIGFVEIHSSTHPDSMISAQQTERARFGMSKAQGKLIQHIHSSSESSSVEGVLLEAWLLTPDLPECLLWTLPALERDRALLIRLSSLSSSSAARASAALARSSAALSLSSSSLSLAICSSSSCSVSGYLVVHMSVRIPGGCAPPKYSLTKPLSTSSPPNIVSLHNQSNLRNPSPSRPPGTPIAVERLW